MTDVVDGNPGRVPIPSRDAPLPAKPAGSARVKLCLAGIFGIGVLLRLLALLYEPPHHPDEFFQYLEPAWGRLTGASVETWEWRAGVRSWVLPGYHGAWMALLLRLGVRDGPVVATLLRAHWALLSLTLVWAAWRGGALLARRLARRQRVSAGPTGDARAAPAGWQGGLLAALLCAAFPLLVRFSIHTLSEPASILCMVWALVLTGEIIEGQAARPGRRALLVGGLLGLGFCLRIQHAPVAAVVGLWLLSAGRFRAFGLALAAALLPAALFGAVDWMTWGKPFSSFIAYVKFNFFEKGAEIFGKHPAYWYGKTFFQRLPIGVPILVLLCAAGIRASWPFLAGGLGFVALLSTQAHKEERFAMLGWPLLLIAAAGVLGAWLARRTAQAAAAPPASRARRWLAPGAAGLFVLLVLGDGALHGRGNDFEGLTSDRFEAQAWAGGQPEVTGLLFDEPLFVGGYLWFGRPFPQVGYRPALLASPLFSHVLVGRDSSQAKAAELAGFSRVYSAGDFVVLARNRQP